MDRILFVVAGYPVTGWLMAIGVAAAGIAGLFILTVVLLRRDRQRMLEMAEFASDQLRSSFVQQVAERDRRIETLEFNLEGAQGENAALRAELAATGARMQEQSRHNEQTLARFQQQRQQMTDEFKAIAGDVLKSQSETFSRQNREQVDLLLKPLGDKIVEFYSGLTRDRAELNQRIQNLAVTGMNMSQEASNLTRALKGSAQTQGAWGEMILESVMEKSGLRKGEEYRRQQHYLDDTGRRAILDIEVDLPNGGKAIIDSKVSLVAFEAYVNGSDEAVRAQSLKQHVVSLRSHIKGLSGKDYQRRTGGSLDFVFMFVPVEAAFAAALTADPRLIEDAMQSGVLLTTPTTLMSALRTISNLWDGERRQKNAEEIADRAGKLYEKVVGFLGNMDKLGASLDRARQTFDESRNQLAGGNGSLVRQIEQLRELGARTAKQIPADWLEVEATPARSLVTEVDDDRSDGDEPRLRLAGE